jgi:hypothetical protein
MLRPNPAIPDRPGAPPSRSVTQLSGSAGCASEAGRHGCARGRGLGHGEDAGPNDVAVSLDGRNVYVAVDGVGSVSVAVFARDVRCGRVPQLDGVAGCVSGVAYDGCATAHGLAEPDVVEGAQVAISPNGRQVYLTTDIAIAVFARDATGALTQVLGDAGCVSGELDGCTPVQHLPGSGRRVGPGVP